MYSVSKILNSICLFYTPNKDTDTVVWVGLIADGEQKVKNKDDIASKENWYSGENNAISLSPGYHKDFPEQSKMLI